MKAPITTALDCCWFCCCGSKKRPPIEDMEYWQQPQPQQQQQQPLERRDDLSELEQARSDGELLPQNQNQYKDQHPQQNKPPAIHELPAPRGRSETTSPSRSHAEVANDAVNTALRFPSPPGRRSIDTQETLEEEEERREEAPPPSYESAMNPKSSVGA